MPTTCCRSLIAILLGCVVASTAHAEDLVEFLSGAKARGTVREIRKAEQQLDFEVQIGGRKFLRTYTFDQIHAVTVNGKRHVLNQIDGGSTAAASQGSAIVRSEAEVLQLIDTLGNTPPDWFASTPLDYPKTLELDWPLKPADDGWNNQKNVGQFKWDIINPNPARWRSGVRLIHEIMSRHKDNPALLRRDMQVLGAMYFELFQDYARAAFWLRRAEVELPQPQAIQLAECYWRLGSKQMASEILDARRLPMNAIKLLGEMGQTERAVRLAESFARSYPDRAHEPYLLAGDACRRAGRDEQAISFYEKVLQQGKARNENYQRIYVGRAQDSIDTIELFDQADVRKVADGVYRASSTGYNGAIEVEVRVAGGKIEGLRVTNHNEKQFYAALTDTPNQIIKKQSIKQVDATSRATITSQAIVNATAKALAKGGR